MSAISLFEEKQVRRAWKMGGIEPVTNCHGLKMTDSDGKQRMTDVADSEQLLRLIQSTPSSAAHPGPMDAGKLWGAALKT
jgi:hypothetical protein